jgi:hypothetical protein
MRWRIRILLSFRVCFASFATPNTIPGRSPTNIYRYIPPRRAARHRPHPRRDHNPALPPRLPERPEQLLVHHPDRPRVHRIPVIRRSSTSSTDAQQPAGETRRDGLAGPDAAGLAAARGRRCRRSLCAGESAAADGGRTTTAGSRNGRGRGSEDGGCYQRGERC